MTNANHKLNKSRIYEVLETLNNTYPKAKIALIYSNPWELLVAVILSAQCTDRIVNKVTSDLFRKYKSIDEYAKCNIKELEKDIKSAGFFRTKSKYIVACAKIVTSDYKNRVPDSMQELLLLPGIARKTANVILGNAYQVIEGIAVDTHVLRISQRLRLVNIDSIRGRKIKYVNSKNKNRIDYKKDASPLMVETELMQIISYKDWFGFTYKIIDHGRRTCVAINPKCDECPMSELCPSRR
ncbi:endonuclease III domain-containing protein [Patescibacteria group bacterium]